jgi:hypothetical protein
MEVARRTDSQNHRDCHNRTWDLRGTPGGVALAQEISLRTEPERCLECSPDEGHINWLAVYSSGWQGDEALGLTRCSPDACSGGPLGANAVGGEYNDPTFFSLDCGNREMGQWQFTLSGADSGLRADFTIRVAEVCGQGFVPELGSILLLGSGLAGLVGYAAVRWRASAEATAGLS